MATAFKSCFLYATSLKNPNSFAFLLGENKVGARRRLVLNSFPVSNRGATWRSYEALNLAFCPFSFAYLCSYPLAFSNIKIEIPRDANCSAP